VNPWSWVALFVFLVVTDWLVVRRLRATVEGYRARVRELELEAAEGEWDRRQLEHEVANVRVEKEALREQLEAFQRGGPYRRAQGGEP